MVPQGACKGDKRQSISLTKLRKYRKGEKSSHSITLPVNMETSKKLNRFTIRKDRGIYRVTHPVAPDTETTKRLKKFPEDDGGLIPRIPKDASLFFIVPKLSWKDIQILSLSAKIGWKDVIHSGEIYKARIDTNSTETLAVIRHYYPTLGQQHEGLALYSIRDKLWQDLPPLPFGEGIRYASQCIALNGKIYILGGVRKVHKYGSSNVYVQASAGHQGSREVYVLDVARQGKWKQCAKMKRPRLDFAVAAFNGKIYVFGGSSSRRPVPECEVYNPTIDSWSSIDQIPQSNATERSMDDEGKPRGRVNHKVGVIGDELFLYGGWTYARNSARIRLDWAYPIYSKIDEALLEAYDPIKREWRLMDPSGEIDWDNAFIARGRFHLIGSVGFGVGFFVYDPKEETWSISSQSFGRIPEGFMGRDGRGPNSCTVVGDELLCLSDYLPGHRRTSHNIFVSKGFGDHTNQVVWERANCSSRHFRSVCSIDL